MLAPASLQPSDVLQTEAEKAVADVGTPMYMPPETMVSMYGDYCPGFDLKMDVSFDVYTLAIVGHQLLTGSVYPVTSGEVGYSPV